MAGLQYLKFGNEASFAATSRDCFIIGALGLHGNSYDGCTPAKQLEQTARLCGRQAYGGDVFVDLGHRGHEYEGAARIHICGCRRVWRGFRPEFFLNPFLQVRLLDVAAQVLDNAMELMGAKAIWRAIVERGLWSSPNGRARRRMRPCPPPSCGTWPQRARGRGS